MTSAHERHWNVGGREISCRIEQSNDEGVFYASGQTIPFRFMDDSHVEIGGRRHRFYVLRRRHSCIVWLDGRTYEITAAETKRAAEAHAQAAAGEIRALMPGKLVSIAVQPGDSVEAKQPVAIMESMKMQTPLRAPAAGRVGEIRFKAGDVVEMGEVIMVIAPSED